MFKFKRFVAVSALALLAACGGGGSSSGGGSGGGWGGTSGNPAFTTSGTFSLVETRGNTESRVIVDINASSPGGTPVTYTILPGKDADQFAFLATGRPASLIFLRPVSFETPRDTDRDNVYEVDVRATNAVGSTTQTVRVTVTNSNEGLVVSTLTTVADVAGGHILYLAPNDQLLVVGANGRLARLSAQTGASVSTAQIPLAAGGTILDTVVENIDFRGGSFFALAREGSLLSLLYVDVTTGARRTLWSATFTTDVSASLGMLGNNALVAIGDAGNRDAAQAAADLRGSVVLMQTQGLFADPSSISVTPAIIAKGLRSPRYPTDADVRDWVMDRGERFNELNQPNFPPVTGQPNYEWPIRDGLIAGPGFAGTPPGGLARPRLVQEIVANQVGPWLDAVENMQGLGWTGAWIFSDDRGNLWTWDRNNDGPIERRNLDFGLTDVGPARAFTSMTQSNLGTLPIYLLRNDGAILVARVEG